MTPSLGDTWRSEYRANRYLQHLSQEELVARAGHLMTNLLALTAENKIGLLEVRGPAAQWHRKWGHALEEFVLRHGPFPAGMSPEIQKSLQIPDTDTPPIPPAYADLRPRAGSFLVKLGRREHLEPFIDSGVIRIAPASAYDDPSLNAAIADDELSFETITPTTDVRLELLPPDGGPPIPLPASGNLRVRHTLPTNYYVSCFSTAADFRLFGDFGANACVVIRDPREFLIRLTRAFRAHISGFKVGGGAVRYLDPLEARPIDVYLPMVKHFRYWYQWEYRVYWLPDTPLKQLEPLFLDLGSLGDIADILLLP